MNLTLLLSALVLGVFIIATHSASMPDSVSATTQPSTLAAKPITEAEQIAFTCFYEQSKWSSVKGHPCDTVVFGFGPSIPARKLKAIKKYYKRFTAWEKKDFAVMFRCYRERSTAVFGDCLSRIEKIYATKRGILALDTVRNEYLSKMWMEAMNKDEDLVNLCWRHRQDKIEECRGITWNLDTYIFANKERASRIQAQLAKLSNSLNDKELALMCVYEVAVWEADPKHVCHSIVWGLTEHPTLSAERVDSLAQLYFEFDHADRTAMLNCYRSDAAGNFSYCATHASTSLKLSGLEDRYPHRVHKLAQYWADAEALDRPLVEHCFRYHQFDRVVDQCRGISHDKTMPFANMVREQRIRREWTRMEDSLRQAVERHRMNHNIEMVYVLKCAYNSSWRVDPFGDIHLEIDPTSKNVTNLDDCYWIVYPEEPSYADVLIQSPFTPAKLNKIRDIYKAQIARDHLDDCLMFQDQESWCQGAITTTAANMDHLEWMVSATEDEMMEYFFGLDVYKLLGN